MKQTSKLLLIAFFLIGTRLNNSFAQIAFYQNNSESGLEYVFSIAKRTGKLVMIDCYTDWCTWCKKYDRTAFANETVGIYANGKFVCYKLDMETPIGAAVGAALSVSSYPTILWITPEGEVVKRLEGYHDTDMLLGAMNKVYYKYTSQSW